MRLLPTITILTIILHSTVARWKRPRPSPMMGALQNILSPANAERTMQMVKMATQRSLGDTFGSCNPPMQPQIPMKYSPPIIPLPEPCNSPLNLQIPTPFVPNPIQSQMPIQLPSSIPIQMPSPMQVQIPNPISYQISSQMPLQLPSPPPSPPLQLPVQLPSPPIQLPVQLPSPPIQWPMQLTNSIQSSPPLQLPCQVPPLPTPFTAIQIPEVILERPPCPCEREIIYPYPEVIDYIYSPPVSASVPEVIAPIPLTSAQDIYTCPLPSPAALFTLPAASPGSSSALELATGTRSHYLRKIPIPPPTL